MSQFVVSYEGIPEKVFDRLFHAEKHVSDEQSAYAKAVQTLESAPEDPAALGLVKKRDVHLFRGFTIEKMNPRFTAEQQARLDELSQKAIETVLTDEEERELLELGNAKRDAENPLDPLNEVFPSNMRVFEALELENFGIFTITEVQ